MHTRALSLPTWQDQTLPRLMDNVLLMEGRFGQYEQVNASNLWINWTRQISAEGPPRERPREPGPGVFYGQIREKDDPDTAYDCVVKCHLSEAFTEESQREMAEKRAAANIKLLRQARSPVNRGKQDHDLAYHVVSSYSTETIEENGRRRYILQPLELCSANLQSYLIREAQYSPEPEANNYGLRKQLLKDIVCGLKFVHNKGFSHRKVEPTSILVTEDDQGSLVAKLSDFALVKEDNARYGDTTRLADPGSLGYIAPELQNRREGDGSYKKSMDIFSLGIVAYQLMAVNSPASQHLPHPFDSQPPDQESTYDRMVRLQIAINEGKLPPDWQDGLDPQDAEAGNLIECMLHRDPTMRPDVDGVLQHPFFWAPMERMKHLFDLSNWLRDRPHDLGLKLFGIGKARSDQEVITDALFPVWSVFNVRDWTHISSERGVLYSVFKDCQEDKVQQGLIGSRSSFLASVVVNSSRHFRENGLKQHCLNAIYTAQPNNVAVELSKASFQDPSLQGVHRDELLVAYFQLKFPKLVLLLKTMHEYFPYKDSPQPTQGMSACCRLFYQKHADPGLAQGCLEDPRLHECRSPFDFITLSKGGEGRGCQKCARQEDHFCRKNYDGVGLLGPPHLPSFSCFAKLKQKEPLLIRQMDDLYKVLFRMYMAATPQVSAETDLATLEAQFSVLTKETERLLEEMRTRLIFANFDWIVGQKQRNLTAPELQEQAHCLGQQLKVLVAEAAHLEQQQQQQQQQEGGASTAAAGACQALCSAAEKQLKLVCTSLSKLLKDSRDLLKKKGFPGVYTIANSMTGQHNEGSDEYMLAKCWAHYPTPESLGSTEAIPLDADRGGYLLVPIPLKPAHQLEDAIDTTDPSTVSKLRKKHACLGGCRCSKVVKSFLGKVEDEEGGEGAHCTKFHGPFWELPLCELCHPSQQSSTAPCVDHVCTSIFHGGYQPVDLRGDGHPQLHDFELSPKGSGIYTSPTCTSDVPQNFIFARMADGKNRKRVPLNWSPGRADCVFGAWCLYPAFCPFHHGRTDKPQEPLQSLAEQCSECSKCMEAMQRKQLWSELQQEEQQLLSELQQEEQWRDFSRSQLRNNYADEGQLQELDQKLQVLQRRVGRVLAQLLPFKRDQQQLNHFCNRRTYACFTASSKPQDLGLDAGGVQMMQVSPPSETARGMAPGLYALEMPKVQESCDRFVAAVQHVVLPQFGSSYYTVVPLRVYRGNSEDKCPRGCSCPDGMACPKDHYPPGLQPCTDERGTPAPSAPGALSFKASLVAGKPSNGGQPRAATEGRAGASSSTSAEAIGVSSVKRADMPSSGVQPAITPSSTTGTLREGPGPSRGITQPAGTKPSTAAGERSEAPAAPAAKGKKGKKKGNNKENFSLEDLRGK